MKLIAKLLECKNIIVSALCLRFKDIIPLLTLKYFLVVFTYPEKLDVNKVKCFALAQPNEVFAVFTSKRDRFRVINKVFHSN